MPSTPRRGEPRPFASLPKRRGPLRAMTAATAMTFKVRDSVRPDPVLQPHHDRVAEVTLVVGHPHQRGRASVGGNHQVPIADRPAAPLQSGADVGVAQRVIVVPSQAWHPREECRHQPLQPCRAGLARDAIELPRPRDDRHEPRACLLLARLPAEVGRCAPDRVGAAAAVEPEARPRTCPRCCGARSRRSGVRSRCAKNSSQPAVTGDRSKSLVTGPRRIPTSSPAKRNSAGRRTAWLLPLRNSSAVRFFMSCLRPS